MTTLVLLGLYALVGIAAAAVVRWLRRPSAPRFGLVLWSLPIVFAFPGFFADRTILPVDHAMLVLPWSSLRPVERHNPNLNDVATHMAPWAKAVRMAWKEGSLPWRQRWNGAGMALAANGQSAAFSPLTFLMFALPLARAFTLAVAVKLFLALFGMWLWLSELGVSRASALFGAVCFGLSGVLTPWVLFPHASVICLWPWALFAIELLRDDRVLRRALAALTAIFLLWVLGGHPESAALGGAFAVLWIVSRALWRDLPEPGRVFKRVGLAAAMAIGLSAFLLIPQAFAIARSSRVPVAREFARRLPVRAAPHAPFWRNGFVTAVFPRALGDAVDSPMIAGGAGSFPEMTLGYFGILGWAAALAIVRPGARRRRAELALLVPLVAGLGVAVAQWPFFEIAVLTPVLGMMFSLRYFSWVALAGAAIAAFELDRLSADLAARKKSSLGFLAVLAGLAAFGAWTYVHFRPLHAATGGLASQGEAFAAAGVCLAAAAALFLAVRARPGPVALRIFALSLSAIAAAELLYQGMRLYRFGSPGDLYPDTPMLAFLRSRPGPFRVVGEGAALFPNSNIFAGLEDVRTKDPVERLDYVEFLDATCGYPPAEEFKQIRDINASALDFLNVRYLIAGPGRNSPAAKWQLAYTGPDGTVFENRDVLPRVYAPAQVTFVGGRGKQAGFSGDAFTAFGVRPATIGAKTDWKQHAFVLGADKVIENSPAQIGDYRESTNEISFRAGVAGAGAESLLVASLVQDGGWSARDENGRWIPTALANGPFLALRVPSGDRRILLKYAPPGFAIGSLVSVVFLLAAVASAGRRLFVRQRGTEEPEPVMRPLAGGGPMPWIWLAGATAVLAVGVSASRLPLREGLRVPVTPLDYANPKLAGLWRFLDEVHGRVPEGASFTVRAPDRDDEMALYMFSLGLLDRQVALPSSYYGAPQPSGDEARFVLAYGNAVAGTEGMRLVFQTDRGAVYERERR
jgi:hypothetical protein